VKPLTRYTIDRYVQGWHERAEMTADPDGRWYAKDEADARIAEKDAHIADLAARLVQRERDISDDTRTIAMLEAREASPQPQPQPQAEPVAWRYKVGGEWHASSRPPTAVAMWNDIEEVVPLYTAPQPQASAEELVLVDELVRQSGLAGPTIKDAWQRIRASLEVGK
jgi:hypothetical protein